MGPAFACPWDGAGAVCPAVAFPSLWLVAVCRRCWSVGADVVLMLRFGEVGGSHLGCTPKIFEWNYTSVLHHSVDAAVLTMQLLYLCF